MWKRFRPKVVSFFKLIPKSNPKKKEKHFSQLRRGRKLNTFLFGSGFAALTVSTLYGKNEREKRSTTKKLTFWFEAYTSDIFKMSSEVDKERIQRTVSEDFAAVSDAPNIHQVIQPEDTAVQPLVVKIG